VSRNESSSSMYAESRFRRVDYDGVVLESDESLMISNDEAMGIIEAASGFSFTNRAVRGIRILSDHQKPTDPYTLSIVFDRHRKRK
jgi:hypothetical protein